MVFVALLFCLAQSFTLFTTNLKKHEQFYLLVLTFSIWCCDSAMQNFKNLLVQSSHSLLGSQDMVFSCTLLKLIIHYSFYIIPIQAFLNIRWFICSSAINLGFLNTFGLVVRILINLLALVPLLLVEKFCRIQKVVALPIAILIGTLMMRLRCLEYLPLIRSIIVNQVMTAMNKVWR